MSRLVTVVYSTGSQDYIDEAVSYLNQNSDKDINTIVIIDNGSEIPFVRDGCDDDNILIRLPENTGTNKVMPISLSAIQSFLKQNKRDPCEIIAFLHCDVFIQEKFWDRRVLDAFDSDPKLGLLGFVGSNEIDASGGRGTGTMLNFQGYTYKCCGQTSPAESHGLRIDNLRPAAVLDHLALIFRTDLLSDIVENDVPIHFYDRIVSCETLSRGQRVAVLGIKCDHAGDSRLQNKEQYNKLYKKWRRYWII